MDRNQGQMRYGMNQRSYMQSRSYQRRMPVSNNASMNRAVPMPAKEEHCSACEQHSPKSEICQFPIAMAYVPWQTFETTYPLCEGLNVGTIFPELNLPFERGRCQKQ